MNWVGILKKLIKICVKELEDHQDQQEKPQQKPQQKPPSGGYPGQQHQQQSQQQGAVVSQDDELGPKRINGQAAEQYWQSRPEYVQMREAANKEGDKMGQCFDKSQEAYKSGDGSSAKEYSTQGNKHKEERNRLNKQAADWIFEKNNLDNKRDEVDLHGLYVREAVDKTEEAIRNARRSGINPLKVVVGRGTHSKNHVSKMKPAIEDLMRKENLRCKVDPHNAGQLLVYLDASSAPDASAGDSSWTDEVEDKTQGDACTIM